MMENQRVLDAIDWAIEKCKIGKSVKIPHSAFPEEDEPNGGFWMGKIVKTAQGGTGDVGIHIEGEPIFTRPLPAHAWRWLLG